MEVEEGCRECEEDKLATGNDNDIMQLRIISTRQLCWVFVNLMQARITREGRTSTEEKPLSDWPVGRFPSPVKVVLGIK